MSRETSWRSLVLQADPSAAQSDVVVEYEFTAAAFHPDERTHEGGKRVFRGRTARRGPYATEE